MSRRGEEKGAAPVSGCLETGAVPFSGRARLVILSERERAKNLRRQQPPRVAETVGMVQPLDHAESELAPARLEDAEVREDRRVGERDDAAAAQLMVAHAQEIGLGNADPDRIDLVETKFG